MHNHKHPKLNFFGENQAYAYDQNNSHLAPIHSNLYYLIEVLLGDLKPQSKILCVGVGTGTEIIVLANAFPLFTFVAVDPSEAMLEVCKNRLQDLGLSSRCRLIHGFIHDIPETEKFDAAICLLVLHHTSGTERQDIITGVAKRLKSDACFITSELSADFSAENANDIMENWKSLSRKAGTSEEKIQILPKMMQQYLSIISPPEVENILHTNGFGVPTQFFQSFLIRAWYARKN